MVNKKANWLVYMVQCANRAYYTGITNDLARRMRQHNSGKGASYTRAFGPVKLLWTEKRHTRSSALKREAQIKKMPRGQKQALLNKK